MLLIIPYVFAEFNEIVGAEAAAFVDSTTPLEHLRR